MSTTPATTSPIDLPAIDAALRDAARRGPDQLAAVLAAEWAALRRATWVWARFTDDVRQDLAWLAPLCADDPSLWEVLVHGGRGPSWRCAGSRENFATAQMAMELVTQHLVAVSIACTPAVSPALLATWSAHGWPDAHRAHLAARTDLAAAMPGAAEAAMRGQVAVIAGPATSEARIAAALCLRSLGRLLPPPADVRQSVESLLRRSEPSLDPVAVQALRVVVA